MTTFALVRREPDDAMIDAAQEEIAERQKLGCGVFLADIWPVALSAQEPLTEEEIGALIASTLDAAYGKCDGTLAADMMRKVQAGAIRALLQALGAGHD